MGGNQEGTRQSGEKRFLLVKRGLYYKPNNLGYTGIKDNAGRYPASWAEQLAPDVTAVPEDEAPEFSQACFEDLARAHLTSQRDALRARVAELEAENKRLLNIIRDIDDKELCLAGQAPCDWALKLIGEGEGYRAERDRLAIALRRAAETFRWYEEIHTDKGAGHEDKAARNRDEAEACEAALCSINGDGRVMERCDFTELFIHQVRGALARAFIQSGISPGRYWPMIRGEKSLILEEIAEVEHVTGYRLTFTLEARDDG